MTMKLIKVLYIIRKPGQARALYGYKQDKRFAQVVAIPAGKVDPGLPKDKNLEIRTYANISLLQKIIVDCLPDVVVFFDTHRTFRPLVISPGVPKIYAHHGMIGQDMWEHIVSQKRNVDHWRNFDFYVGVGPGFECWLRKLGISRNRICNTICPQLDFLLYSPKNILPDEYTKVILFLGCVGKSVLAKHTTEDCFRVLAFLAYLARRYNWLVFFKAKYALSRFYNLPYFNKKIKEALVGPNVRVLDPDVNPYEYFFADHIILNGESTAEVESVCAGKTPIILCLDPASNYPGNDISLDKYFIKHFGAGLEITSLSELEGVLCKETTAHHVSSVVQRKYLSKMGITLDKNNFERLLDFLYDVCGRY